MTLQGDPTGTWPSFQQGSGYTLKSFYDIDPTVIGDLMAFIEANPPKIPITQITGFDAIVPNGTILNTSETTTSTTYTDLATVGPQVTGLADGTYLIVFGAQAHNSAAGNGTRMAISIDGATPADTDGSAITTADFSCISFALTKTLSAQPGGGHTVTAKYRVGNGTGTFTSRYLTTIRVTGA